MIGWQREKKDDFDYGASGSVGREVVREMLQDGDGVSRDVPVEGRGRKGVAGVKTVIADFSDAASLQKALQGVERVFLVCSPIRELVELEGNVIEASKKVGVKRIVLNSALGAGTMRSLFPAGTGRWRTT